MSHIRQTYFFIAPELKTSSAKVKIAAHIGLNGIYKTINSKLNDIESLQDQTKILLNQIYNDEIRKAHYEQMKNNFRINNPSKYKELCIAEIDNHNKSPFIKYDLKTNHIKEIEQNRRLIEDLQKDVEMLKTRLRMQSVPTPPRRLSNVQKHPELAKSAPIPEPRRLSKS